MTRDQALVAALRMYIDADAKKMSSASGIHSQRREIALAAINTPDPPTAHESKLIAALHAARGYMLNAQIDLTTGAPKKTALATIDGGIKMIDAALKDAQP